MEETTGTRRWLREHPRTVDGTVALLVGLMLASTAGIYLGALPAAVASVALLAPLAFRRTNPVASAVSVYAIAAAFTPMAHIILTPAIVAVCWALHSVTVRGPRWARRLALLGALLGVGIGSAQVTGQSNGGLGEAVSYAFFGTMLVLTVWAFAFARRSRLTTVQALEDRARQLETEHEQLARLAAAAERTRIAREMHDIVAHSLSVMIAQADGGRYAAAANPDAAAHALGTIAETGRDALADMRRLLGVLRTDQTDDDADGASGSTTGGTRSPERAPQPASGDIEQLLEQMRESGLRVSLVRMGTARPLPPGVGLALYRVCQESLTNVLKHAGPDPAVTVLQQWNAASVVLEVADDGRGAAATSDGAGHGVLGMSERAAMFGGTLVSGPRPGGGFRVRLTLPLPDRSER
ncbi:Signal transduction histidine kinase [Flavimobilis marinus]|uniref:histidine kinase n=1 Tax=Flavimobilis marinus TaxID=285351 RepID=A0A1I2HFJ4_9MICO|nr:histidine kinase [Flavimobilis marinus]SFF28308.1 Signal transduction histidine kinase [Flavimobilis marinus]